MRILFFSDIHFHHTHNFSQITPEGYTQRELEHLQCADVLIDLYKKEKIDEVICGGDVFGPVGDMISCQTLTAVTEFFRKVTSEFKLHVITGNHDISGHVNNRYSHKLMPFKYWENINVYDTPTEIDNIIYMPYCLSEEYATSFLEAVENKKEKIIVSHLEIKNINLGNGIFTQRGIDIDLLDQFKCVLQGHFHSGGKYGKNIHIVGSTQRLSFKDPGLSRNNIIIYDTITNKVERRSFNCPDWLIFNDDNIEDILTISNDNYVKLDISMDILLTDEIKQKLNKVKDKIVHIDVNRLSLNKEKNDIQITEQTEVDTIVQFVNNSDNTDEYKKALIQEGVDLIERARYK